MKLSTENISISTLDEAQQAIQIVKKRIRLREQDLEERLQQLPAESFKLAINSLIPSFINYKINNRSWSLIKDLLGLLSPFASNKSELLKDVVKQVGIMGILKGVVGLFRKKEEEEA